MWTILKEFKTLPSNPDVANLTNGQIIWASLNLEIDMDLQNAALKKMEGKETEESYETDMSMEELVELTKKRIGEKK